MIEDIRDINVTNDMLYVFHQERRYADTAHVIQSTIRTSTQIQDLIKNNQNMINLMESILDAYENSNISHEQFRIKTAEFITSLFNDMGIKTKAQKWIEDNLT